MIIALDMLLQRYGKYIAGGLGIVVLILGFMLLLEKSHSRHWEKKWLAEHDAYQSAVTSWQAASAKALTDQQAVNAAPAIISAKIAEDSNVQSKTYYADGYRAGAAYADAHRVRREACTGGSESGGASVPGADQAASQHDGPGSAADVFVSRADFDQLVANSLRLAVVHRDAIALIEAGVGEK